MSGTLVTIRAFTVSLLFFAFPPASHAAEAQPSTPAKVLLVAQRSLPPESKEPARLEEASLALDGKTATLVLNSNFLAAHDEPVTLGYFTSPMNEILREEQAEFALAASRISRSAPAQGYVSPHSIRLSLNGQAIPMGSAYHESAIALFSRIWALSDWKANDGVELKRDPGGVIQGRRLVGPKAALNSPTNASKESVKVSCKSLGERKSCVVEGYGIAYF